MYVPTPATPVAPPPQVESLARRLGDTIDGFRREYPALSDHEARWALRIASERLAGSNALPSLLLLILGLGMAAGLALWLYLSQTRTLPAEAGNWLVVGTIGLLALVVMAVKLGRRR